jgi:hypothetical protein
MVNCRLTVKRKQEGAPREREIDVLPDLPTKRLPATTKRFSFIPIGWQHPCIKARNQVSTSVTQERAMQPAEPVRRLSELKRIAMTLPIQ